MIYSKKPTKRWLANYGVHGIVCLEIYIGDNTMQCQQCEKEMANAHKNRRYCSGRCANAARYARTGPRCTPDDRIRWYKGRCKKAGYRDKLREQGNARRRRVLEFLRAFKMKHGCADCGYNKHHAALDFDHVKVGKTINVCFSRSIEQAKREIELCEVVCANCHRRRTYERMQKRSTPASRTFLSRRMKRSDEQDSHMKGAL